MKDIKNYEGLYEISEDGIIKAKARYNVDKNGKRKFYPAKVLKHDVSERNTTNYHRVTLSKNGKTKRMSVHRMVAEAFIENIDNKPLINHIDNDGSNNTVSNLEWCTHSENMIHAQKQGRLFESQSKGGAIAGTIMKQRSLDMMEATIGKTFHNWKVIRHDKSKKTMYVFAECQLCKREYSVYLSTIRTGISKNCRSCGLKKKI